MARIKMNLKISLLIVLGIFALHAYALAQDKKAEFKPVDSREVCMVNNTVMGNPQIPVEFEGKTYYGCCAGCVDRLKKERAVRYSIDPVTGKEVDKAKAVIIKGPGVQALYFESMDTAQAYRTAKKIK